MGFDYLGVYYKNIMYYISTDPNGKVVMHYLDQGIKNRIIENSQIPNQHLLVSKTITLQGMFELMNFFVCPLKITAYSSKTYLGFLNFYSSLKI